MDDQIPAVKWSLSLLFKGRREELTPLSDAFFKALGTHAARKRVLFADDEEAILDVMQVLAPKLKMDLTVARSNADLRKALNEDADFDLVILDWLLLNGYSTEVYEELISKRPKTFVIFVTSYEVGEVSRAVHKIGPAPVYAKVDVLNAGFMSHMLWQGGIRALQDPASLFAAHNGTG